MAAAEVLAYTGADGHPLEAWLHLPEQRDEPGPAIVLVHEVFGRDVHMRKLAARFAAAGFACLVPDLYAREGLPGPASTPDAPAPRWDTEAIRKAVQSVPDRRAVADLDQALAALGAREDVADDMLAVVGFCMGGTLAFLAGCTSTRLSAVVDFYGRPLYPELSAAKPIQPLELLLNLDRPLLAFFGGQDPSIPPEHVELMRSQLEAANKHFELITYPEAGHGFFNDLRSNYHEASATDAWQRTLRFLGEVL